jgi:hypothetical protein
MAFIYVPPSWRNAKGETAPNKRRFQRVTDSAFASRIPLAPSEVLALAFASRDAPKGTARAPR